MSWVNLENNNTFTEGQLRRRKEARIINKFPVQKQLELLASQIKGENLKEVGEYQAWIASVEKEYQAAKADNIILEKVLAFESAQQRLERPKKTGPDKITIKEEVSLGKFANKEITNPELVTDQEQRTIAKNLIAVVDKMISDLAAVRKKRREPPPNLLDPDAITGMPDPVLGVKSDPLIK